MADQLRKDSLGCYGNSVVRTPNIDKLAECGAKFDRCYVNNPICMPNRISIFTGMYPCNHGIWTNGLLKSEMRTLPTELSKSGYQTALFGKAHFEPYAKYPDSKSIISKENKEMWMQKGSDINWYGPYWGFEHVELTLGHCLPCGHYWRWFLENGGTREMMKLISVTGAMDSGVRELPIRLHSSTFVAQRTIDFITKEIDKDKPFFVVASFPDPHHPFDPPKECAKRYTPNNVISPIGSKKDLKTRPYHYRQHFNGEWSRKKTTPSRHPNGLKMEHQNEIIAHTYAMVDLIDQNVGKIINSLDENDLMDDTIIIFTSDHGELLGDHGLWFKGPFFYEGLLNVPLIIYNKGSFEPFLSDDLISSIDIFPTLCDMLELPIPIYVNGVSHFKYLNNKAFAPRDKCMVEYRTGYKNHDYASKVLITKDMKYVRYETGECELTDLKKDPYEYENVASKSEYFDTIHLMNEKLLDEIIAAKSWLPERVSPNA